MKVDVWGNDSMLKDIYRFDDTCQTRGGFEMADLQYCQPSTLIKNGRQCGHLILRIPQ